MGSTEGCTIYGHKVAQYMDIKCTIHGHKFAQYMDIKLHKYINTWT